MRTTHEPPKPVLHLEKLGAGWLSHGDGPNDGSNLQLEQLRGVQAFHLFLVG